LLGYYVERFPFEGGLRLVRRLAAAGGDDHAS
jgi:hypothetical protein